ncbi:B3 domain-containing transcription factor VRN1 [Linum grandiflorum]
MFDGTVAIIPHIVLDYKTQICHFHNASTCLGIDIALEDATAHAPKTARNIVSMKSKNIASGYVLGPGKPHFFKIIVEDTIRDKRLGIPIKFVKEHGESLCSPISLKLPGGTTWKINMSREICSSTTDHIHMWLCNEEWQKFAQHYSLKHGHWLVFQYEGGSLFTVAILDALNGSEIQYPERLIISSSDEFVSEKPFFKVVVCQSHLTRSNMRVPRWFSDMYMVNGGHEEVKLNVGEQWWELTLKRCNKVAMQMNGGLSRFVKDNCLEAGDVCYFELLREDVGDDGGLCFKVTIVRREGNKKEVVHD